MGSEAQRLFLVKARSVLKITKTGAANRNAAPVFVILRTDLEKATEKTGS